MLGNTTAVRDRSVPYFVMISCATVSRKVFIGVSAVFYIVVVGDGRVSVKGSGRGVQ